MLDDDTLYPLAYLITFRCYGTWLHGDARGSMDRQGHNTYRTPRIAPNPQFERLEAVQCKHPPLTLDARRRTLVAEAVNEVCWHRGYKLRAINVRTNHVHTVVTAACEPEPVMSAFKAYATRRLRVTSLLPTNAKPWVRHGSTRYLWEPRHVALAIDYVLHGQGDELPEF